MKIKLILFIQTICIISLLTYAYVVTEKASKLKAENIAYEQLVSSAMISRMSGYIRSKRHGENVSAEAARVWIQAVYSDRKQLKLEGQMWNDIFFMAEKNNIVITSSSR